MFSELAVRIFKVLMVMELDQFYHRVAFDVDMTWILELKVEGFLGMTSK